MDFNNDILIVDVANIRDHSPATMKTRRFEGRDIPLSSLEYLDSALIELQSQVPSGTILKIADFSLIHNFSDEDKVEFRRRTNLDPTDSQYIYLLPFQPKRTESKSGLFRRKPTNNSDFVEADDIILALALELDAYVVSGDYYSDEKFDRHMKSIRERLFVHHFNAATNSWIFVKSLEYYSENRNLRDDWGRISSLTTITEEIGANQSFEAQSDLDIRDFAYNTLIEEFWEHKRGRVTVDLDRRLTSNPLKNLINGISLRPQQVVTASRDLAVKGKSAVIATGGRNLAPTEATHQISRPVRGGPMALPMPTYYASAVHAIAKHKDERIAIMGKLIRSDNSVYLEWVLADKRIKILTGSSYSLPKTGELVRITGTVIQDDTNICLEVESRDTAVTVELEDIVRERVENVRRTQPVRQQRLWSMPAMRWGRIRSKSNEPALAPGFVPRPIPKSFPMPSAATPNSSNNQIFVRPSDASIQDWTTEQIPRIIDEAQLSEPVMTSVDSAGRIEFLESNTRSRRPTKSGRLRRLLLLAVFVIAVAVGLYVYVKSNSETPRPTYGSGSAIGLNIR